VEELHIAAISIERKKKPDASRVSSDIDEPARRDRSCRSTLMRIRDYRHLDLTVRCCPSNPCCGRKPSKFDPHIDLMMARDGSFLF
jgi:hypothetical protein